MAEKSVRPVGLGLFLTGSYDWAGGLYYMSNVIKALKEISEEKKIFRIIVFVNHDTPQELIDEISSGITIVNIDKYFYVKLFSRLTRFFFKKDMLYKYLIERYHLKYLFPFSDFSIYYDFINSYKVSWIFDFQHKYLPEYFSAEEILKRDNSFNNITAKAQKIVLSSNDALQHFNTYYNRSKNNAKVVQFASFIDALKLPAIHEVKKRYQITCDTYFIVSNQFWQHKNHIVVLKAIKYLKEINLNVNVIFTGKEGDYRNPGYFKTLLQFITDNNISENVRMLGFIDRNDQLALMKGAAAVIQPSCFEGWSTVVEDTKALNVPVILSDIPVHREQMGKYCYFFNCDDHIRLSAFMKNDSFILPSQYPNVFWNTFKEHLEKTFND